MTLNPVDHAAEAERLLAVGQNYLDEVSDGFTDEAVDLAGLHFDKAQVHATLAHGDHLRSIAESLRAIVKTDDEIEEAAPEVVHLRDTEAVGAAFHTVITRQIAEAARRQA